MVENQLASWNVNAKTVRFILWRTWFKVDFIFQVRLTVNSASGTTGSPICKLLYGHRIIQLEII